MLSSKARKAARSRCAADCVRGFETAVRLEEGGEEKAEAGVEMDAATPPTTGAPRRK